MRISLFVLGLFGCLVVAALVVAAIRIGLHEACYAFDGENTRLSGEWSIHPYWLTFRSIHDVTYREDKEAFHDRAANFPTLELAMHGATRVNADRVANGQPRYTVVHSSDGTEWSLDGREIEGVRSQQLADGGINEPKGKATS